MPSRRPPKSLSRPGCCITAFRLKRSSPLIPLAKIPPISPPAGIRQKCELCHAYDGSGKTSIGGGQYPHPPALRSAAVEALSDGEIFYHIRNGIRNTAMPAWGLPDRWQLVSYIRDLPQVAQMTPDAADTARRAPQGQQSHYVGSAACKNCHENVYARWSKTLMANVVRDPRQQPDAIIPDLSKPDPLLNFTKDDVALIYGTAGSSGISRKSATITFATLPSGTSSSRCGGATSSRTAPIGGLPSYPPDNLQRPTGPLLRWLPFSQLQYPTRRPTEWNVGCEKVPRPWGRHAAHATRVNIVNPARFDYVHANDVCIQCHSQGRPLTNPIQGRVRLGRSASGPGCARNLADVLAARGAQTRQSHLHPLSGWHRAQESYAGERFVASLMYTHGVTCFSCHDLHGRANVARFEARQRAVPRVSRSQLTGRAACRELEQHSHHKRASAATNALLATCRRSSRPSPIKTSAVIRFTS